MTDSKEELIVNLLCELKTEVLRIKKLLDESREREWKLRKSLENIIKHYEIAGGNLSQLAVPRKIAQLALKDAEVK